MRGGSEGWVGEYRGIFNSRVAVSARPQGGTNIT